MEAQGPSGRISAVLLAVGAAIGLVGNGLHPHTVDTDAAATLRGIAANDAWIWIHAAIVVAVLLVIGGLVGFAQNLRAEGASELVDLGVAATLVGGGLVCVSTAIDGFGRKALTLAWSAAPSGSADAVFQVATGAQLLGQGIWTLGILVFFGAAFVCFGAAANAAGRPGWVAFPPIVGGLGSTLAASLRIASNGDVQAAETLFLVSSVVITLWLFALGVTRWRSTRSEISPRPEASAAVTT